MLGGGGDQVLDVFEGGRADAADVLDVFDGGEVAESFSAVLKDLHPPRAF